MSHLRLCLYELHLGLRLELHPQAYMESLGITYEMATPQSMGEQRWFWGCRNAPNPLPSPLSILDVDPYKAIGYGLSKADADRIANMQP